MAKGPRIVAELGRPETAQETADRKAQASHNYRSSKTFRNLIAAMLATLGVVIVIVLGVPRGELTPADDINVAEIASGLGYAYGRTVISPDVPGDWLVNSAQLEGDGISAFTIVYVPDATSFIRVAQGFDADAAWVSRTLSGETPDATVTIAGIEWDQYDIDNPERASNISYALATPAGPDQILLYGTSDSDTTASVAEALADQIRQIREESP